MKLYETNREASQSEFKSANLIGFYGYLWNFTKPTVIRQGLVWSDGEHAKFWLGKMVMRNQFHSSTRLHNGWLVCGNDCSVKHLNHLNASTQLEIIAGADWLPFSWRNCYHRMIMKRNPKKRIISVCILLYRKISYSRVLCKNIICEQENFLKMVRGGGGGAADSTLCIRLRLILFVPCYKKYTRLWSIWRINITKCFTYKNLNFQGDITMTTYVSVIVTLLVCEDTCWLHHG